MNRIDFQQLAEIRLREARALLAADCFEGAYYLAGYAVECALKACIAKKTQAHDFPDKNLANSAHTHDLERLIILADLQDELKLRLEANPDFDLAWDVVLDWKESSRYETLQGSVEESRLKAASMIGAVSNWGGGVLPWVQQHW